MTERAVATAAELDAMTPAGRQEHFEDSIVRPTSLTEEQTKDLLTRLAEVDERTRPGVRRTS